jgi:hypothetical protein
MDALRALPLQKGWIYEVVICTFSGDVPHAAPFGVWTDDYATLEIDMYAGSRTLENVLASREFVVAFPPDVPTLFAALFAPEQLVFGAAGSVRAPSLAGAAASVELVVRRATPIEDGTRISALPRRTRVGGGLAPINRADGLLLESLVLATRLDRLGDAAVMAALAENQRVVRKVAPGSPCEHAMSALLQSLGTSS